MEALRRRTLFWVAVSFLLAALAADRLPPSAVLLPAAIFVGLALHTRERRFALLAAAVVLAVGSHLAFVRWAVQPVQALSGQTVVLCATVESERSSYQDSMSGGTLRVYDEANDRRYRIDCAAFPQTPVGDCFDARFALSLPEQDEYLYGNYADGIYLSAEYVDGYEYLGESTAFFDRVRRLQAHFSALLRQNLSVRLGGIAAAMIVGDKTHLPEEVKHNFRNAGLSHLLVVSGMHLSVVCGLVWDRSRSRRRFSRLRSILCMGTALFLMLLAGLTPSVLRAGLAVLILHVGLMLLRPADPLTSLATAGLLMTLPNCYMVCDVGFQLSFMATLGVLIASALTPEAGREDPAPKRALYALWQAAALSFFASVFTLPVLLLQGLGVSSVSVLSNLLTLGLLTPILGFGLATVLFGCLPLLRPLYYGCGLCLGVLLRILYAIVQALAALPFARLYLPPVFSLCVWAALAVLGALAFYSKRPLPYLCSAALCLTTAVALYTALSRDVVKLTLIGTKNNPCVVIQQNGQIAVIFRGGASNRAAVEDYLQTQGGGAPHWLLDLRREPGELEWEAESVVTAEAMGEYETFTLWPQVAVQLLHDSGGNLAVIDVEGYSVAVSAGRFAGTAALPVDCWVAGPSFPEYLLPETVLTGSDAAPWQAQLPKTADLWYANGQPSLWLRPGRSVCVKGAKNAAQ